MLHHGSMPQMIASARAMESVLTHNPTGRKYRPFANPGTPAKPGLRNRGAERAAARERMLDAIATERFMGIPVKHMHRAARERFKAAAMFPEAAAA